ncbi:MAG TPA: OsmC family protein [Chloroflexia bacterium]|nr:OsmC family protein [Chloroflexia bacterium]
MNTPTFEPSETQPRLAIEPVDASRYESVARLSMPNARSGMAFAALAPSSHSLTIDTGPENGGEASGPEPLELLLISLGACTGMDVISILHKKRQLVTHYSVNVHANRAQEHPKIYTHIMVEHVVAGQNVDPKAVARSLELSITKYCPVHALLSRATHVEHIYRVIELPPGGEDCGCG